MKAIRVLSIVLFFAIILAPVASFNWQEGAVSAIDNRMLTENPFAPPADAAPEPAAAEDSEPSVSTCSMDISYTVQAAGASGAVHAYPPYRAGTSGSVSVTRSSLPSRIENYVNDRIGFRDEMILGYTVLNDRLFGKMVHPSYSYGKDGYVFGSGMWVNTPYTEYHEVFADMVLKIQNYCEQRDIPFLFMFEPAKPAVLTQYLPDGMRYDRSWVDSLLAALDERGVHYVDTTDILREKTQAGEVVFNQKYNANHWNYLGAYYGTRAALEELRESVPTVHVTAPEELEISEVVRTSLLVSEFPINEAEPVIGIKDMELQSRTEEYSAGLYRHPSFPSFNYIVNPLRSEEGAPRALVFQGSYMNGFGHVFFSNAFSDYIFVHDYQNVIDFPYFYQIFRPDCVIFEVAEYTLTDYYFSLARMRELDLPPTIAGAQQQALPVYSEKSQVTVKQADGLTTVIWPQDDSSVGYAWLTAAGKEYDMYRTENGFEVTLTTEEYQSLQTGA